MKKIKKQLIDIKDSKLRNLLIQLRRSYAIAKKDFRIYYNKPPVLVQGLIFPIILFIAFTIGRNVNTFYLISGLITMVLFLTSTSIGPFVFPWETMRKTFERVITCPISLKAILLGSMISSFIFGLIFSCIPLILAILFFSLTFSVIGLLIIIFAMIVAAFVFSSFSLILSSPPTDMPGNIMIFTLLLKFTILFISPLFMPIQNHPLAIISPLTYIIDIINIGLGLESAFGQFGLLIDFIVLIIFGNCFLFLAFTLHEKTVQKRFR